MIHPAHDEARRALIAEARRLVEEVADWAERLSADSSLSKPLADARAQLDDGFLLVVIGEFNAGKSAFINALLGASLLEEGVTPTTSQITRLRFADEAARLLGQDGVLTIAAPAELLRTLTIVDTPGTNAVLREHEALTRDFVPRADLVLFVTSVDRPYTETERALLEALREWGKKVVLVVNKADLLRTDAERERVRGYVCEQAQRTLGRSPEVFLLSARRAQEARARAEADARAAAGIAEFEAWVTARLDEAERERDTIAQAAEGAVTALNVAVQQLGEQRDADRTQLKAARDYLLRLPSRTPERERLITAIVATLGPAANLARIDELP